MTEQLMELADRCEAAKGPDRELDLLVKAAVFGGEARMSPYNGEWCLYDGVDRNGRERTKERPRSVSHAAWITDRYSASLDAAMQLYLRVPERIPSNPRLAAAEGLRQRAGAE